MLLPKLGNCRPQMFMILACALFLAAGCKGSASGVGMAPVGRLANSSESSPAHQKAGDTSVFVSRIPRGALGPRLAFSARGTVVVWADTAGEEPSLYSVAMGQDGVPFPARRTARVDKSARQLTLGWTNDGELLASMVHKKAGQEVLTATRLSREGVFISGPQVLATTPNAILYTKVVPTALGAVVLWVERAGEAADLYSIVIDERGPRRPTRQARAISAWQVVGRGGSIAVVTREGVDSPSLMFRHLGDRGETIGAPIELSRNVVGGKDVDVAVNRHHILVAWSEKGAYHTRIFGTILDANGNVTHAPFPLTAKRGDQALVSILGDEASDFFHVIWREPLEAHHGRPSVFIGRLSGESPLAAPRYHLNAARKDPLLPIFASKHEELAVLTDFDCEGVSEECAAPLERASLLLSGSDAAPKGARLRVNSRPSAMAWDLSCSGNRCLYLLNEGDDPARIHLATLDAKDAPPPHIVERGSAEELHLVSHETLAEVPELAELHGATWEGNSRSLLAWVSYFQPDLPYIIPKEPAADGRRAPLRARLSTVHPAEEDGTGAVETIISYRARSLGGVHLVAPEGNRGLLLWSALDENRPRLFATLVDAQGKKVSQRTLTNTNGEVTDIAGVRVEGGYLVSWVDGTGAAPRVLALRVNDSLVPVGNPRVVAERTLSPSGVTLLSTKEGVFCVWSDARDAGLEDTAQLFGVLLDSATGAPRSTEQSLTAGQESAYAPRVVANASGNPMLAWISQPSDGFARLRFGALERGGALSGTLGDWSPDGDVRDFSLACDFADGCRVVALVAEGEEDVAPRNSLWALSGVLPGEVPKQDNLILPLWTPTTEGVTPVLLGDDVYYADRAEDGSGWHLRRATIHWSRP